MKFDEIKILDFDGKNITYLIQNEVKCRFIYCIARDERAYIDLSLCFNQIIAEINEEYKGTDIISHFKLITEEHLNLLLKIDKIEKRYEKLTCRISDIKKELTK